MSVRAVPPPPPPEGRFSLAFDATTLAPTPTWTVIESLPGVRVSGYTIDRGRQYELDHTDTGRAVIEITDRNGLLDPTNVSSPYFGKITPLKQAALCRRNPITNTWRWRFRGFVESLVYDFHPSQKVNRLTITLVDIFEILNAVEMLPYPEFGMVPPTADSQGQVWFQHDRFDDRIFAVLGDAGIPVEWYVVFTGNVNVLEQTYSPGESAMSAIQEACDAEFPGVSNVYTDKFGRLAAHGRLAKFDPVGTAASASIGAWDFHQWKAGDGDAVELHPTTVAQLRQFAFSRDLSKIINQASAYPADARDEAIPGQTVKDTTSIGTFWIRSWSAQNLLTKAGLTPPGYTGLQETRMFADYYVRNYARPQDRISGIAFRSMRPDNPHAAPLWSLLCQLDIADAIDVSIASPGGGGFNVEPYFVEGVHEQVRPLGADYDDVTMTLDLSPRAFFNANPWD